MQLTDLFLLCLLALVATGCAATGGTAAGGGEGAGPIDPRTKVPPGVDPAHLHFTDTTVEVGSEAPLFTLPTPDGQGRISLQMFRGMPLVLVFGSHT